MISINAPLQFGQGITVNSYLVTYQDLTGTAGSSAITLKLGNAAGIADLMPQGTRILGARLKPLVKPAATSLSALTVALGWDNTVSGGAVTTTTAILGATATFVTVSDTAFTDVILVAALAPGDLPFNLTATFTETGAASWSIMTAGTWAIDIYILKFSMGELWNSQYYGSPSAGQP